MGVETDKICPLLMNSTHQATSALASVHFKILPIALAFTTLSQALEVLLPF